MTEDDFRFDLGRTIQTKGLSQKLYEALDWPPAVYNGPNFPFVISGITYSMSTQSLLCGDPFMPFVNLHITWRDGTTTLLTDVAAEFPSATLLATLNLMAGPQQARRTQHRKNIEKELEKRRARDKYSNRPW